MIMVKVDLGKSNDDSTRKVGYFANLHCMAYQVSINPS